MNILYFSLRKLQKYIIFKIKKKTYPERCFEFCLSISAMKLEDGGPVAHAPISSTFVFSDGITWTLGALGESCTSVCNSLIDEHFCDITFLSRITTKELMTEIASEVEIICISFEEQTYQELPSFKPSDGANAMDGTCLFNPNGSDPFADCEDQWISSRRICPCKKSNPGET